MKAQKAQFTQYERLLLNAHRFMWLSKNPHETILDWRDLFNSNNYTLHGTRINRYSGEQYDRFDYLRKRLVGSMVRLGSLYPEKVADKIVEKGLMDAAGEGRNAK